MWSKITSVIKSSRQDPDQTSNNHQASVMSGVLEQHPNLSVFHNSNDPDVPFPSSHSPPGSPSKHSRRSVFTKMLSRGNDDGSVRSVGHPKRIRSPLPTNGSQLSLGRAGSNASVLSPEAGRRPSQDLLRSNEDNTRRAASNASLLSPESGRRSSQDMLRSNDDMTRSSGLAPRRPSLDILRPRPSLDALNTIEMNAPLSPPMIPTLEHKGSVRSILREPNTPGTGRNVRFFSRDIYGVRSPDESAVDSDTQTPQLSQEEQQNDFLQQIQEMEPQTTSTPLTMPRTTSSGRNAKPSLAEVFSPLREMEQSHSRQESDMSLDLFLPAIPPPGLDFDFGVPIVDTTAPMDTSHPAQIVPMSSTPFRDFKGKTKEVNLASDDEGKENVSPPKPGQVDETIFHAREKSPRLPPVLHDRSQSFSLGQTMFYSLNDNDTGNTSNRSSSSSHAPTASIDSKNSSILSRRIFDSPASTTGSIKSRGRALSDTVFHSMLRSGGSRTGPPESDINDESSQDLVVYAKEAPDPFRADANTYYGPQTMIPTTPPRTQQATHARKTSKEENVIASLQAQLALQTELCGQYESDLRARDELVDILGRKLAEVEKEDVKRKGILRAWKKKVAELERTCRYLEEEVEGSRQESMERSIMDEASGEALRMLHRQISSFEREKGEWARKEEMLRDEVGALEQLVKERTDDMMKLKQTLWSREESERELKSGIQAAQEQMEMLGNISIGMVDEEEIKKLMADKEQRNEEEKQKYRAAQLEWEMQREEFIVSIENLKAEKVALQGDVESLQQQIKDRDEEYSTLKAELEAQWQHTETAGDKLQALEKERRELEKERETLKQHTEDLEERINNMELEWNESENRRNELEQEVQELWNTNEALEKERDELDEQMRRQHEAAEDFERTVHDREARIEELQKEHEYAVERVERLEASMRRRDTDSDELSERIVQREAEAEQLREQLNNIGREHSRAMDEQTRALREANAHEEESRAQLEVALKHQAEADVELRASRDRLSALSEEIERLRRQLHRVQQESADNEVKLVQLHKDNDRLKDDNTGLNIALDSKQQELELLKRKFAVRGTAGSTPAPASKQAQHRRDSSVFSTPGMSRPPSVMSDSGKEDNTPRIPTLTKSTRVNTTLSNGSSSSKFGNMGPPAMKPRPSFAGTPTPAGKAPPRVSSLAKSALGKAPPSSMPSMPSGTPLRRTSSTSSEQSMINKRSSITPSPVPLKPKDEKENKRRSMIPA